MDHWDPALTDGLAANRPVILFDNTGVAGSSGQTTDTVEAQADNAAAFIHALGLTHVDVLGFSTGGYVAPLSSATPNSYAGSFLSAPSPVRATTEIGTPMSTTLLPETKCSLSRTSVSYSSYRRRPAKPRVNDSGSAAINGRWTWIRPHPSSRCRPGQPRSSTGSSHMVSRSRN
jgi:pimeloyl-ACP methyl ester carboxylesterase